MATLLQGSFTAGELAPSLCARVDLARYALGCRTLENFIVHPHGGASNRAGTVFIAEAVNSSSETRLIPFIFSADQAYMLEFSAGKIRVFKDGGVVVTGSGVPVEVTTTFLESELSTIKFTQSSDVLFLMHPDHPAQKLSRTSHVDWTLEDVTWGPQVASVTGLTVTATGSGSTTWAYGVTFVDADTGEESACVEVSCANTSTLSSSAYNTLSWSAAATDGEYNVYRKKSGKLALLFITSGTSYKDDGTAGDPDTDEGAPQAKDPFKDEKNPAVPAFFQQRLCVAATNAKPQTIWMSQTSQFYNHDTHSPVQDSDACTFTIFSRLSQHIMSMCAIGNDLLVLTVDAEWKLWSGDSDYKVGPSHVAVSPQGYRGSTHVPPLLIGSDVLHVQRQGNKVRSLSYALDVDGYKSDDLTLLANHLFTGTRKVREWAYAQTPDSIVWVCTTDGLLYGLTYMREQEVWAWHRHPTDGLVESVATIPGDDYDELWLVVRRQVGGEWRRYVERMAPRGDTPKDAIYLDCCLTYSGTPARQILGLEHLEGRTVAICSNGSEHPRRIVINGAITLDRASPIVHVGLPYESTLETMDLDVQSQSGSTQGKSKRVSRLTVKVQDTVGLAAGPDVNHLDPIRFRTTEPYGKPVTPFTGPKRISFPAGVADEGRIVLRQSQPLPCTILAIIPEVEFYAR